MEAIILNKPFCMALAEIYIDKGMTQQDVADAAGISTDTITNLRKGGNPSKRVERSLCRVIGKTPQELFPDTEATTDTTKEGAECVSLTVPAGDAAQT